MPADVGLFVWLMLCLAGSLYLGFAVLSARRQVSALGPYSLRSRKIARRWAAQACWVGLSLMVAFGLYAGFSAIRAGAVLSGLVMASVLSGLAVVLAPVSWITWLAWARLLIGSDPGNWRQRPEF